MLRNRLAHIGCNKGMPFESWGDDACNMHLREGCKEEHDSLAQAPGLMGLLHEET
jgi:hypothetical protein